MAAPKHVYETFIRATPAEVWAASTRPEITRRYFHHTSFESELTPGASHRYVMADGTDAVDGTIEQVDPERRLVMTWHVLYDAAMADEPPGRVEWTLTPANDDATVTRLTVRHLDLGLSPLTSDNVALGWVGVIDSMKTLLETGEPLGDFEVAVEPGGVRTDADADAHRRSGAAANGEAWDLLAKDSLEPDELDDLIDRAHASSYHWRRATAPNTPQQARAAWLLARTHTVAGHADLALHHAQRCAALTESAAEAADFDVAYAHEAMARALALAGHAEEAARHRAFATAVTISDHEDRAILEADIAAEPWFGLDRAASHS